MGTPGREVVEIAPLARTCMDCREAFTIEPDELRWWQELAAAHPHRKVLLPNTCHPCRRWRRQQGAHLSPKNWTSLSD